MCCLPLCGVGLVEDDASWGYFDALTNSIHTRRGLLPQLPSPGLGWISDSQAAVSIDRPKQLQSKICTDGRDDRDEEAKSSASNSATDEQQRIIAIKLQNAELQTRIDILQNELVHKTEEAVQLQEQLDAALVDRKDAMKMADKAMKMAKRYKEQLEDRFARHTSTANDGESPPLRPKGSAVLRETRQALHSSFLVRKVSGKTGRRFSETY